MADAIPADPRGGVVRVLHVDGVAVIVIHNPPVNTIDAATRAGLAAALDEVEGRRDVRAVVVRCEGRTFCSGADVGEFAGPPKEREYRELFRRLEQLPVPVVVALHGAVLGGGLELALAGHYRVAAAGTRLGLPEVTLGIIPGAGGTQRLPRLIGVDASLDLILGAAPIDADAAQALGIVDEVTADDLSAAALAYARRLLGARRGPRRTRERAVDPASGGEDVLRKHRDRAAERYPNREAARSAIAAVAASLSLSFEQGLDLEAELVDRAKRTDEARGAVHLALAERETRHIPGLAPGDPRPIRCAGVVGLGTMGTGIALCFANAGLPVTVLDVDEGALRRGLAAIEAALQSMQQRGRITADELARRRARVRGTLSYADLGAADVLIEAVPEILELKLQIFRRLAAVAKPGAVLATNTSTLDLDRIASAVPRPEDVVGMHFFSPAHVMPLLEVVRGRTTSASTLRTVMDLAAPLRKTPVLSGVCHGFIGNRMMAGYAREAQRIMLEGATPRQVDTALERWGMAMGILAVFDLAGVDVGVHVHRSRPEQLPTDPTDHQADLALFEAGRLGQKTGRGYYRYQPGDRTRYDDPEAVGILRERARALGVPQRAHSDAEIVERCLLPVMNEGFRILDEGIAQRAGDIDVVWAAGYGFPRHRGGPLFHAQSLGLRTVHEGMMKYRRELGALHWQPAELLERLVREGRTLQEWEEGRWATVG